mmetsp:Transcript_7284/g.11061  ORF Transcript_7284/g.11061 Transcript_7284/m.11061 type:complete len:315 (-) Transcript_7284:937-1881(-)
MTSAAITESYSSMVPRYIDSTRRNSAIAGCAAGVTGTIFAHPVDSFKVWLQTNSIGKNKYLATTKRPTSKFGSVRLTQILESLQRILLTVRAFYSGISAPIMTVGVIRSIDLTMYDQIRRTLYSRSCPKAAESDYRGRDPIANVAISGFVSGAILSFVTSPVFRIRERQQITGKGLYEAAVDVLYENGRFSLRRCYVAFIPHFISSTLARSSYYAIYETSKRQIGENAKIYERMVCASMAGTFGWALIFPFDALRSRMYNQSKTSNLSTMETAKLMYNERAFYRGFWVTTIFRAVPVAAIVLPVYDFVLEQLER